MNKADRNTLVVDHLPLVGYVVSEVASRSRYVAREDLASAGAEALVRAADTFDPERGVPFGAYARQRIRGSLIDELRRNEWLTRSAVKRVKSIRDIRDSLEASLNRHPTIDEIAAALGIERAEVETGMVDETRNIGPIDEVVESTLPCEGQGPEGSVLLLEESSFLAEAVAALPAGMRYVVEQLYYSDRNVKDLAEELGSSHSAVSQKRAEALRLIKDAIGRRDNTGDEMTARISASRREAYLASVHEKTLGGLAGQHHSMPVVLTA